MKMHQAAVIGAALVLLAACGQNTPSPGTPSTGEPSTAPSTPAAGGLTGPDRDAFTSSAITSCTAKQQADPGNQGIAAETITQFCTCYANKMADSISPSEMVSLNEAINRDPTQAQAMMQPRIDAAQTACAAQIRN